MALKGRDGHPEDYLEEDARDLEQNRLFSDEALWQQELQEAQAQMTQLQDQIQQQTHRQETQFCQLQSHLAQQETRIIGIEAQISQILSILQNRPH